jgi:hypothetical protein
VGAIAGFGGEVVGLKPPQSRLGIPWWYPLMRTRVPDLPKGSDNQRLCGDLTQIDPASEQHDPKPRNRSTTSPKVINRANMIDLAEKANPRL